MSDNLGGGGEKKGRGEEDVEEERRKKEVKKGLRSIDERKNKRNVWLQLFLFYIYIIHNIH